MSYTISVKVLKEWGNYFIECDKAGINVETAYNISRIAINIADKIIIKRIKDKNGWEISHEIKLINNRKAKLIKLLPTDWKLIVDEDEKLIKIEIKKDQQTIKLI